MFKKDDDKNKNPFKENENLQESNDSQNKIEEDKINEDENSPSEQIEEGREATSNREEELVLALDSLNNKYIRLAADFDNFRKRQVSERESLLKYGAEDTLKKIVTVLDTYDRAKDSVDKIEDCQVVKEGYDVVFKQLFETLNKIGLTKIDATGETFDPQFHEAIMQTPTTDYPNYTIINELQTGYKYHEKVIRPAMVNVAVNDEGSNE